MASSDTVIREVTKGVWTFSRPFWRYGIFPFGGRSTAIRMQNGGVWVLASTPLNSETKSKIDELGPVKYIIGADAVHYMFLGQFQKAYPSAKLIAPQAAIERNVDKAVRYDGVWGRDPPETQYGFEEEIKSCYFSGFKNKDVAFMHAESKSLIQADLLLNLPAHEQFSKSSSAGKIWGTFNPDSWIYRKVMGSLGSDKEAMKRDVETVSNWDFDRIIPCHGDVIETGGKEAWRKAFQLYFE